MNLNPDLLSSFGNNLNEKWEKIEYMGGKLYKPPNSWIGFGLNVLNKYDKGNNDRLTYNGRTLKWCVAYHGAIRGKNSDEVKRIIKIILEINLKADGGQSFDINHPGQKFGLESIVYLILMFLIIMREY